MSVPASKHDPAATPTLQATGTATPTLHSTATPMPRSTASAAAVVSPTSTSAGSTVPTPMPTPAVGSAFVFEQHTNLARTVVSDANGQWSATFPDGAFAVTLARPVRIFAEASAAAPVVSIVRVRMLPTPFFRPSRRWLVDEGTCRCVNGRSGTGHAGGRGRVRGVRRRRPTDRRGSSLWTAPGRRNEDRRIKNFKGYLGVAFD